MLKADVAQFYPTLYTHAIAWAVDPKSRQKRFWSSPKLLGNQLDLAIRDADRKISQGIPIGNDISFLLAEVVLAQVDRALKVPNGRAYRWFDDYEIAVDTRQEAENVRRQLRSELDYFRLRLNPSKTQIIELPKATEQEWRRPLVTASAHVANARGMLTYFDTAFKFRDEFPDTAVLLYALGILFRLKCPKGDTARVAQSCITQAVLCEPGAAQKAFALLSFWCMNGMTLDAALLTSTIDQIVLRHDSKGPTSDVAWALAFCLEHRFSLSSTAAKVLARFDDDCILLLALDLHAHGLLPSGFTTGPMSKTLKNADLDREHWLLAYETVRQGFLMNCAALVSGNPLFADLLATGVSFYRRKLPPYASVIHPGGAPEWSVGLWFVSPSAEAVSGVSAEASKTELTIRGDLARLRRDRLRSYAETVEDLLDILSEEDFAALVEGEDEYSSPGLSEEPPN